MAIFETGYAPVTSVGTIASIIFNAGSVSAGSRDVTVINTGPAGGTIYVGGGSAAANATTGIPVVVGAQVTLQGAAVTLWANVQSPAVNSTCQAGLATLASVV